MEDRDVSFNAAYKLTENQEINIEADYHYGDWGKPRGFNGPTKAFTKIRNLEERMHSALHYSYLPGGIFETVNFNMYYDKGTRDYYKYKYSTVSGKLSSLDLVHYKDNYAGGNLFSVLKLSETNKLNIGMDGYFFELDNPAEILDYYYDTRGDVQGYINAGQKNIGFYLNDEANFSGKFKVLSGIRYDYATVNEGEISENEERNENRSAFSGNLGMVYSFKDNKHLSLNLGRAFRMPTAEELFTEVISCKGTKVGNPDLQPEYSWNIDLGFRGKAVNDKMKYDFALFYNILDGYINELPVADDPDIDFTYMNIDAVTMGGEFSGSYSFDNVLAASNSLSAGIGISYVYGIDKSSDEDSPLFGVPPLKINAELFYRGLVNKFWITGYTIKFNMEYAAAQGRVAEVPENTDPGPWGYEPSEAHTAFNATIGLNSNSLPGFPKIRFIVKNIFDTDYYPFGSYIPVMGRNFKILILLNF